MPGSSLFSLKIWLIISNCQELRAKHLVCIGQIRNCLNSQTRCPKATAWGEAGIVTQVPIEPEKGSGGRDSGGIWSPKVPLSFPESPSNPIIAFWNVGIPNFLELRQTAAVFI